MSNSVSEMKKLTLSAAACDSEIYIGRGIIENAAVICARRFKGRRAHIVTDSNVSPLLLPRVSSLFADSGFTVTSTVIEAGEASKSLAVVGSLYDDLVNASITRADLVVALGGGVIGDTAGFAASTFLRGINLCQIPTTLLAQVDSSVGGKCGTNLPSGKNLVGSFYQPHVVVIDPDALKTLPESQFCDGMAEVIKYGFIADKAILLKLASEMSDDDLTEVILRCVEIKRDIVMQDERDLSVRMLLNFGHTIGHALEALGYYQTLTHGQAVALGMKAAIKIGISLHVTEEESLKLLTFLLDRYGLLRKFPYPAEFIADALSLDKKIFSSTISFILIKTPGEAVIHHLSLTSLKQLLPEIFKEAL